MKILELWGSEECSKKRSILWLSILEAIAVMIFIHIPLFLSIVWGMFEAKGEITLWQQAYGTLVSHYAPQNVMTFVAGLLAASTAYFIVNYELVKIYTRSILSLTFSAVLLLTFAAPLLLFNYQSASSNEHFATTYAYTLVLLAIGIWFLGILRQNSMEPETGRITGKSMVSKINETVRPPQ